MRFPKRKAMVAVAGASVLGVVVAAPAYWFMGLPPYAVPEMILRSGRTALAGALITADYKGLPDETAKDYQEKRRAVHQRTAERMLAVCRANAGVYTKVLPSDVSLLLLRMRLLNAQKKGWATHCEPGVPGAQRVYGNAGRAHGQGALHAHERGGPSNDESARSRLEIAFRRIRRGADCGRESCSGASRRAHGWPKGGGEGAVPSRDETDANGRCGANYLCSRHWLLFPQV